MYKKRRVAMEFLIKNSIYVLTYHCLNIRIKQGTDQIECKIQNKYSSVNI